MSEWTASDVNYTVKEYKKYYREEFIKPIDNKSKNVSIKT